MPKKLTEQEKAAREVVKALKKLQKLTARHNKLTQGDPDLRELRTELMATSKYLGFKNEQPKYTEHSTIPGFKLAKTKKGRKPSKVVVDFPVYGLTKNQAKKELGGTSAKDLLKSSVQLTWRPNTLHRDNDEGLEYRGKNYSPNGPEQTILMPFKMFRNIFPCIDLDADKRGGVLPPASIDRWLFVASMLMKDSTFTSTANVESLYSFINRYICVISGTVVEEHRPAQTLISIKNIVYQNHNNQTAPPIDEIPFGFFATHLSSSLLTHDVNAADTWDEFIKTKPVPKELEGYTGYCAIEPLVTLVKDSAMGRKGGNTAVGTADSVYQFGPRYLWDLGKNRPPDGPIYKECTVNRRTLCAKHKAETEECVDCVGLMKSEKGVCVCHHTETVECADCKVVFSRGAPIFLPPDHPDYHDMDKADDLCLTLKEARLIFEFFDLTVVVRDEHENELWRYDRTKNNPDWRSNLDFVAKNGHLYLCPKKTDDRHKVGSIQQEVRAFREPVTASNRFKVAKPKSESEDQRLRVQYDGDWRLLPDFIAKTVSTTDKNIIHIFVPCREVPGQRGLKTKHYENDLKNLFFYFRHEKQFEAEIGRIGDMSIALLPFRRFKREGDTGNGVVVNVQALSPEISSIEDEDKLLAARDELDRRIFIKGAMSSMNEEGMRWYGELNMNGGIIGNASSNLASLLRDDVRVYEADTKTQHPAAWR